MNIAICDDNMYMLDKLESVVSSCFQRNDNDYSCDAYSSGEEIIKNLEKQNKHQIYLLDIEMKKINGLQVAAKIREFDQEAIIIFVTSHDELMPEAFNVLAFNFIVKPFDYNQAKHIILKAIQTIRQRQVLFQFVIRKKTYTLYVNQITFFESINRKVIIHTTTNDQYEYYGTLKELKQKLNHYLFAQVHNSYIVNMEHIKTMSGEGIVLNTGDNILVTKSYHKEFHEAYKSFVLMRVR